MTTVQSVTGPVDGADLGRTLVHEHIRISYNGEELDPKDARLLSEGASADGRTGHRRTR